MKKVTKKQTVSYMALEKVSRLQEFIENDSKCRSCNI